MDLKYSNGLLKMSPSKYYILFNHRKGIISSKENSLQMVNSLARRLKGTFKDLAAHQILL